MKADAESHKDRRIRPRGQRGYALVALLALMTVLMITAMSVAPSMRQQSRRERELEAIRRGEEVAEGIRRFIHYKGVPPTSMEELLEGAPVGTKKVKVIRASSARDPLTESGEWKLVKENDRALITFIQELTKYTEGRPPQPLNPFERNPAMAGIAQRLPRVMNILDTGSGLGAPGGGEDSSLDSKGPFIGVVSRSERESIIAYYGIERYDGWIFTPFFR